MSYIDNKKAAIRNWHRVLAKVRGDKLEIITLQDNDSNEVNQILL